MSGLKRNWLDALEERARDVKQRVDAAAQRVADARVPIRGPAPGQGPAPAQVPAPGAAERKSALAETERGGVPQTHEEPPVVARMIVEIRSDGTRTVARGALEDIVSGERVKIEASGGSPIQLAASLASNLLSTPFMLGRATSALVRNRLGRSKRE